MDDGKRPWRRFFQRVQPLRLFLYQSDGQAQQAVRLTGMTRRQHADGKRERLQLEHQQHHVVWSDDVPGTGSGATATQTRDGNMVMDASGAMSRLPVGINATRQIAVAQQEMARRRRTEQKVPCMVSAAVLPVPGTRSVSLVLTGEQ